MDVQSFGKLVGTLIFQKRKALGLTQIQLAEDAFGTSAKTRRISELENGTVSNPHPKTIDPLIVVLGISETELEECANRSKVRPDPDLDRAYREARNLIEAVARQFDHENPNATFSELDEYLREKAREWRLLRDRIESLETENAALKDFNSDAKDALANAHFDEADAFIAQAEHLQQQNRTLKEVRSLVELRLTRADINILADKPDTALEQYLSAVDFLLPFDEKEAVDLLNNLAGNIYEAGRRSIKPNFQVSIALLERALQIQHTKSSPEILSKINYRLSLIYRNLMSVSKSDESEAYLEKSIKYARCSILEFPMDGCVFDLFSAKISLGNVLIDKAKNDKDIDLSREAIDIFKEATADLKETDECLELRSHAYNSLGSAIMTKFDLEDSDATEDTLDEAIDAYTDSIKFSEAIGDIEVWGGSQINIGMSLAVKSKITEERSEAFFLRLRSIGAYLSAIETFPSVNFPTHYAKGHVGLADILFDHGMEVNNELSEIYLARSIASYVAASEVYDEHRYPLEWGRNQMQLGRIFAIHAQLDGIESVEHDYTNAIDCFKSAMRVFDTIGSDAASEQCQIALNKINQVFHPVSG